MPDQVSAVSRSIEIGIARIVEASSTRRKYTMLLLQLDAMSSPRVYIRFRSTDEHRISAEIFACPSDRAVSLKLDGEGKIVVLQFIASH